MTGLCWSVTASVLVCMTTPFELQCCKVMCWGPSRTMRHLMWHGHFAGWTESTEWADGLRKTVQWYQEHGCNDWWDSEAVEASLEAHPVYFQNQCMGDGGAFKEAGRKDPNARLC